MNKSIMMAVFLYAVNMSTQTMATEITYETCTDCPSCGTNCKYTLNDGRLTIYGPTEKNANNTIDEGTVSPQLSWVNTNVETVDIKGNITTVGADAFYRCGNITEVTFSDSVKTIGNAERYSENGVFNSRKLAVINFGPNSQLETIGYNAFRNNSSTEPVIIPASVKNIGALSFYRDNGGSMGPVVFEGIPENIDYYGLSNFSSKIYCRSAFEGCSNFSRNVQYYTKTDDGLYVLTNEQGEISDNPTYFISANLMALDQNGEKGCKSISECKEIINALNQNKPFTAGGKFYASLSDWASGTYAKKRIYTVDEANMVAGRKNKVIIRYK